MKKTEKKKRIVLFGGSFNPAHLGHMRMAKSLHEFTGCDEVWMMFAQNNFKNPKDYASLEDRLHMAELLKQHIPDTPVVFNTLQEEMQTHETIEVLKELSKRHPDYEFVWTMGTDSLARFHEWGGYNDIIENHPIVLVNRPGYEEQARRSQVAKEYKHLLRESVHILNDPTIGEISSTAFKKALIEAPHADFADMNSVADHAVKKGLYGIKPNARGNKKRAHKAITKHMRF